MWKSSPLLLAGVVAVSLPPTLRAQSVRDSAGIRIVENPRPILPPNRMWRVDPTPALQIGVVEGDSLYEFLRIMAVMRLDDGRIVVANSGSNTLRFYDAQGRFLSGAGRPGQGPGEFTQVLGLERFPGDSIAVKDLSKVHLYAADGSYGRMLVSRADMGSWGFPYGFLPDGSFVGTQWRQSGRVAPRSGTWTDTAAVARFRQGRVDTLALLPSMQVSYAEVFGGSTSVAFSPHLLVAAFGEKIFAGFGDRYEIRVMDPNGRIRLDIRRIVAPRAVPRSAAAEYRRRLRERPNEDGSPAPEQMRARFERASEQIRIAETYPAFSLLLTDRVGQLWVQHYEEWEDRPDRFGLISLPTPEGPSRWDVFNPGGGWLGTITLPDRFRPTEIGADYVAGIWRDEDDVEFVRIYRLIKP